MRTSLGSGNCEVDGLIAQQSGIISLEQLTDRGVSLRSVRRLVGRGSLVVVFPGVYRSATWPHGRDQLMVAGCLRNPGSALAYTTAGQIHGLRKMHDDRVHFLLPHGSSPNLPGVIVHRCRKIDTEDVIDLGAGIRVTSIARTLFDVGAVIGRHRLLSALEHAVDKNLVSMAQISETTLRLFHKRRPGSREIKNVLAIRSAWSSALQSDLELQVLRAIRRHGLPTPRVQHELTLPGGMTIRFDFAWPTALVSLEVDHSFWHAGSEESRRDKRRDRLAAQEGWITIRITEDDVLAGLDGVMKELAEVVARRTRAPRST